jgi:hypothetical protein
VSPHLALFFFSNAAEEPGSSLFFLFIFPQPDAIESAGKNSRLSRSDIVRYALQFDIIIFIYLLFEMGYSPTDRSS